MRHLDLKFGWQDKTMFKQNTGTCLKKEAGINIM
jgi:hypothetical protein